MVPDFLENREESNEISDLKYLDETALLLADSSEGRREVVASRGDWSAGVSICSILSDVDGRENRYDVCLCWNSF
jgi:hypothetical protein